MIIWYKDNVAFIYIKMNPLQLRKEVEEEMKRTRLDKTRLYDLLLKIVDSTVGGEASAGPAGERGPAGPAGPAGERGPAQRRLLPRKRVQLPLPRKLQNKHVKTALVRITLSIVDTLISTNETHRFFETTSTHKSG
jgi:hypothetical protein